MTHLNQPAHLLHHEDPADSELVQDRTVGWVLLVAGLVGFTAAFILAVQKYWLLTNPFYQPSCSVNETISCGPIMTSDQAAVLGFPNPYLGIAGFAIVAATGEVDVYTAPVLDEALSTAVAGDSDTYRLISAMSDSMFIQAWMTGSGASVYATPA